MVLIARTATLPKYGCMVRVLLDGSLGLFRAKTLAHAGAGSNPGGHGFSGPAALRSGARPVTMEAENGRAAVGRGPGVGCVMLENAELVIAPWDGTSPRRAVRTPAGQEAGFVCVR